MSKQYDPAKPFQNIADASRTTGISQFALRRMVREGVAPYMPLKQAAYILAHRMRSKLLSLIYH